MNDMPHSEEKWLEKLCQRLWESLDIREEVIVTKDSKGKVTTTKTVLPTHEDLRLILDSGLRHPLAGFEIQRCRAVTERLEHQMLLGQIEYLDALCMCEVEGVTIPESWKLKELSNITMKKNDQLITASRAVEKAMIAGLPVPPHWKVEAAIERATSARNKSDSTQTVIIQFVTPPKEETTPTATES